MFTDNTRDSSGVNPKGEAWGIYIWTVKCITHKHQWGVVWLVCTTAGIQIIVVLLAFTVISFPTKPECSTEQLLAADLSYCWLPPCKQAIDRFMLFARLDRVLFFRRERSVEQVLTADLSARAVGVADYWSQGVWIISQVPLTPGQSQVINWIAHGGVRWVGLQTSLPCSNHPNCHVLTEQFADSACSNYCTRFADLADIPGSHNITTGRCLWFVWLQWSMCLLTCYHSLFAVL